MCDCTVDRPGRRSAFLVALFGLAAAAGYVRIGRASAAPAFPAWTPNERATPARVERVRGVTRVVSLQPAADLLVDSTAPREAVRLLWLNGRVTQPELRGSLVLDDDGGLLRVDDRLRVRRPDLRLDGRDVASASAAPGGSLWVTTLAGEVLRVDASGRIAAQGERNPFAYASVASGASGEHAWLVRSSSRFAYRFDPEAPLLSRLSDSGLVTRVGGALMPGHSLLVDLANAGTLAVRGDTVYFAPFIRDEIVAMRSTGDTLWVASRGLPQSTPDPRFELTGGRPVVNYHPVNLGIAVGPDGLVYVLSTPGFTTSASRLDVFDSRTGTLLRSARFPTALPTLAVSASGRTYRLDGGRLVASAPGAARERAPVAELQLLHGAGRDSIQAAGKVSLVNVWASWCTPCREEMPALDSLQRDLGAAAAFRFVSINEDVRPDEARRFLDQLSVRFPVLAGGGRAKDVLRYPGLPYTLLIDGDARVVRKWIGYGGPSQIAEIRTAIDLQLGRLPTHASHMHH